MEVLWSIVIVVTSLNKTCQTTLTDLLYWCCLGTAHARNNVSNFSWFFLSQLSTDSPPRLFMSAQEFYCCFRSILNPICYNLHLLSVKSGKSVGSDIRASFKKQNTCWLSYSVGADPTNQPRTNPSSFLCWYASGLCLIMSRCFWWSVACLPVCCISRLVLKPATITTECQSVHRHQAWPRWPSLLLHSSKPR